MIKKKSSYSVHKQKLIYFQNAKPLLKLNKPMWLKPFFQFKVPIPCEGHLTLT